MPAIPVDIDLTPRQFSKFKRLLEQMHLQNGKVFLPTNEMHGVLLTSSKQSASNIIDAHLKYVQPYLKNINNRQYIKHIGIDVLLSQLEEENPRKKHLYLAVKAYISGYLANDPRVYKDAQLEADGIDKEKSKTTGFVKKRAKKCALSGVKFSKGVDRCVHHIEGASEQPSLVADPENLICLTEKVHDDYHAWVLFRKLAITRATLKQFAIESGYSTNW